MLLLIFSCKNKKEEENHGILLRFGDKALAYQDVVDQIPDAVHPADSVALFHQIIEAWIKDEVLADFAEDRLIDTRQIDAKVREYRNYLIVLEYLNKMRDSHNPKIDDGKVKEYYDLHREYLKLETPLIKGVFIKINSDIPHKEEIKKLMTASDLGKIDVLENEWIDKTLQYDYFRDKWIDWETVKGLIPYRFNDPEQFLEETNFFETDYGDCTFYLQISDYLLPGDQQPFEFAKSWIASLLTQAELADYENSLVNSIVQKSIKDGKLEVIGYDPIRHDIIDQKVKENEND